MADVSVIGSSKSDCSSFSLLFLALDHGPAVKAAIRPILSRCATVLGANVSYDGEEYDCCCCFVGGGAAEFLLEDEDSAAARVGLIDVVLVAARLLMLDILGGGDNIGLEELIASLEGFTANPAVYYATAFIVNSNSQQKQKKKLADGFGPH